MSAEPPKPLRLPKLPQLLDRKIYKTGQTRGADDDVIYQNRVGRNSTVLIPHDCWGACTAGHNGAAFENGFIVLLSPGEYFGNSNITTDLARRGLALGKNVLVFYETRQDWNSHNPDKLKWKAASKRTNPLGGQYVARISATTAAKNGERIVRGFNGTAMKGAGIRVYEYASTETTKDCRLQLEALFWLCTDADRVAAANGMLPEDAKTRKAGVLKLCQDRDLLDKGRLVMSRIMNVRDRTTCPLCLEELSSQGFFNRMEQAEGRLVPDLTVTELNLFHIDELRISALNHRPYNLGWGHHHCNVVVKDSGITKTLEWMGDVLRRNAQEGYLQAEKSTG
jgi:hypothetical protein